MIRNRKRAAAIALCLGTATTVAAAGITPAQQAVQDAYVQQARAGDPGFTPSASRGEAFFTARHVGGKPDSPSCTSCHTTDLKKPGKTRAGKEIAPMAVSVNPKRYVDPADVEKWFKRNCSDVLGRACTAAEKADVLAHLLAL